MIVRQFEIDDNNTGNIYLMSIETACSSAECLEYLQQFSRHVAHVKTKDKRGKKQKGGRKILVGTIVDYKWRLDCCNIFDGVKKRGIDLRNEVRSLG
ncbi:hypothetical protein [Sporomusa aerivorans]|uniref:hypothetical protein n=1 Tax=Sporomusa aerivorans TaxID=204936 RepID=UPI00352B9FBD